MKHKLWAYFDFNVKVKVRRVQQLGNDGVIQWFKKNCLNNTWIHHLINNLIIIKDLSQGAAVDPQA